MNNTLFLASKSPRRRELLQQIGVRFIVIDVDVEEQHQPGESAQQYVERLSLTKAKAGAAVQANCPVLGADTIVVLNQEILEKPQSKQDAIEMLMKLSGKTHSVYTAVALYVGDGKGNYKSTQKMCCTDVTFRTLSNDEIERYWDTHEPKDKAGAYGIQGYGAVFVEHLSGSYSNVVGLPLMEVQQLLAQFGISVWNGSEIYS